MERAPNTNSPEEVRRSIQRLRKDFDGIVETDPIFVASAAHGITADKITDWDAAYDREEYSAESAEAVTSGMPVYGTAGLAKVGVARADTAAKSRVVGLALNTVGSGFSVTFLVSGRIERADWTAITGSVALTPNSVYYLSATGGLTTTAPTTGGYSLTEVGQAVNATTLNLTIKRPLLL